MRWVLLVFFVAAPLGADTTIKGGRMELINKGESVLFTEGVRLDRGTDQLKAQRMQTNKKRDKVTAWGNVRLFRRVSSTETWRGSGETGFYNTQESNGYLEGGKGKPAVVVHTEVVNSTTSRIVNVRAARIDFFRDSKMVFAKGSVTGDMVDPETNDRYDFWADKADFDGEKKTITLYGPTQPIVLETTVSGKRTVTGDKIVYELESKRITSEGRARAVMEDKDNQNRKKAKSKK